MSKTNAVFVTGATGLVGSAVVEALLGRGESVVAAVRADTTHPGLLDGAEARAFDFTMTAGELDQALTGCDRLFLMRPPAIEDVRKYMFPLINAARRRGIRQIVFLSLQGVQHNKATPHYAVEQYLKQLDAPYTLLRPNFFMQNLSTTYAGEIRDHDEIYVPAGRSFTAFIDTHDIGRVAAAVFTEGGHLRKAYTLSGEQALTYRTIATLLSDVVGRDIRYARPSERDYLTNLARQGKSEDYIAVQRMIYRIVRLNISAFPNRMVRKLTGTPAATFRDFAEREHRAWKR